MAFSIEINEAFFSAKFVMNNNVTTPKILLALSKYDPSGTILDSVNGNTKAAFAILIGAKLYECKQLAKVNSQVNFTNEFTKQYEDIAKLYRDESNTWDVKIKHFRLLPEFLIEEVA